MEEVYLLVEVIQVGELFLEVNGTDCGAKSPFNTPLWLCKQLLVLKFTEIESSTFWYTSLNRDKLLLTTPWNM